jgi:hypothetical protein
MRGSGRSSNRVECCRSDVNAMSERPPFPYVYIPTLILEGPQCFLEYTPHYASISTGTSE